MWKNESKIGKNKESFVGKITEQIVKNQTYKYKMTVEKENKTKNIENSTNKQHSPYIKNIFPFYILTYLDIMNSSNE